MLRLLTEIDPEDTNTNKNTCLTFNVGMQKRCDVLANGHIDLTIAG